MAQTDKPYEGEFNRAIDLYHAGEIKGACDILQDLAGRFPGEAVIHGILGGYLHEAGLHERALPHLSRAVTLSPRKAVPARELFLVLFELQRYEEARDEARRFHSSTNDPELLGEWSGLLHDIEAFLQEPDAEG